MVLVFNNIGQVQKRFTSAILCAESEAQLKIIIKSLQFTMGDNSGEDEMSKNSHESLGFLYGIGFQQHGQVQKKVHFSHLV